MPIRIAPVSSSRSTSLTKTECASDVRVAGAAWGARSSGFAIVASDEAVAGAAHGADEGGLLGIVAELLTQPRDQHVDRAVVGFPVETARRFENPVAGEDASAVLDQQAE